MKENVFDVLMYLFENYMDEGPEFHPDQDALTDELTQAGFNRRNISAAFQWLEGLSQQRDQHAPASIAPRHGALRHFTDAEREKFDRECRGLLLFLEQSGVLDAATRELVVERGMALEVDELSLEQLKWVILMVLFHQPGLEHAYALFEDLVFDEMQGHLH